jgi:HD-GYP domain-containing protein (c-di-GMP phosphodiesterase class II)
VALFDRITLRRDLTDCQGRVLARRGFVISPESIVEAAASVQPGAAVPLGGTAILEDLQQPLTDPTYRHLFRSDGVRDAVTRVFQAVRLPTTLLAELAAMRQSDPPRYRHALATAAVTVRMLEVGAGRSRTPTDLAAAALLHDLGMHHVPARVVRHPESLHGDDSREVVQHPLLGAYHIACVLGDHPAVEAALTHHWREGQGYPDLPAPPSPAVEVVAVASAFAALTHARAYRSDAYEARGAVDLLVAEAATGFAEPFAVKLLVHALRGGDGEMGTLRFARGRPGHRPTVNHHTRISAPAVGQA